jgi:CheY-like chemotaxis protein
MLYLFIFSFFQKILQKIKNEAPPPSLYHRGRSRAATVAEGLDGFVPDVQLVGLAGSAKEGLRVLREGRVDILVLDIYLPDLTGINLLKSLPACPRSFCRRMRCSTPWKGSSSA